MAVYGHAMPLNPLGVAANILPWVNPITAPWALADQLFNRGRGRQGFVEGVNNLGGQIGGALGLNDPEIRNDLGAPDLTNYNQDRSNQSFLLDALKRQMAGEGPSLAQGQLQQATDANIRNAMALGAAQQGQGLGYGAALRSIAENQARAQQDAAGQSALIRNKEMLDAQNAYGALTGGMAGQSLNAAGLGSQADLQREAIRQSAWDRVYGRRGGVASGIGQGIESGGKALGGMGGMARGGPVVPGRATVSGDSSRNDTVPAMLSPGEIVLPRSVAQAEDAPEKAEEFVAAIQRMKPGRKGASPGSALRRIEALEKRLKALEAA